MGFLIKKTEMNIKFILLILAILTLFGCIYWFIKDRNWEAGITIIDSLAAIISITYDLAQSQEGDPILQVNNQGFENFNSPCHLFLSLMLAHKNGIKTSNSK